MRSLLPGYPDNPLFEAIFIDLLPANARDAAVKHELLEDMAETADKVMAEAPSTAAAVTAIGCHLHHEEDFDLSQVSRARARPPSSSSSTKKTPPKDTSLCYIHKNYGRAAFKCASPTTCKMRDVIAKPSAAASGNVNAGGQ